MQHIAKEGRCYVLGITRVMRGSDVPADLPGRDEIYGDDDDWLSRGNTMIVDPSGRYSPDRSPARPGILYAEIDARHGARSRAASSTWSGTTRGPTCSSSA